MLTSHTFQHLQEANSESPYSLGLSDRVWRDPVLEGLLDTGGRTVLSVWQGFKARWGHLGTRLGPATSVCFSQWYSLSPEYGKVGMWCRLPHNLEDLFLKNRGFRNMQKKLVFLKALNSFCRLEIQEIICLCFNVHLTLHFLLVRLHVLVVRLDEDPNVQWNSA